MTSSKIGGGFVVGNLDFREIRRSNFDTYYSDVSGYCICVRDDYQEDSEISGRWADVENGFVENLETTRYFNSLEIIDDNNIKVTGLGYSSQDWRWKTTTRNLIRAGIPNVKVKGAVAKFGATSASPSGARGYGGAGSISLILKSVANPSVQKEVKNIEYTDDQPVEIPADKQPEMPTGDVEITVKDETTENTATFTVSVIGEETDIGVMTVANEDVKYQIKTSINHENDFIYYGTDDSEAELTYSKTFKICNTGTEDIGSMKVYIELDDSTSALVRSFTPYTSELGGFGSGTCKEISRDIGFKVPDAKTDVKFNIKVKDFIKNEEWYDYVAMPLSKYKNMKLYFSSNTKTLNGFLVAPGRTLIRVQFSGSGSNNYVRVPLKFDDEYEVVVSSSNIENEDTYMLSTVSSPDTSKMSGFEQPMINEPDNNISNATEVPLAYGEAIGYLLASQNDIDFYKLVDLPSPITRVTKVNTASNIYFNFPTSIDSTTVTTDNIKIKDSSGNYIAGSVSYDSGTKTITFDPTADLTSGLTYTVEIQSGLKTATGNGYSSVESFEFVATKETLPQTGRTAVYEIGSYFSSENIVTDGSLKLDGYYQKGYTSVYSRDNSKDIVVDNIKGLTWQDSSDILSNRLNFADAATYCANLSHGDYTDWRVPTINELIGLINTKDEESIFEFLNKFNDKDWGSSTEDADGGNFRTLSLKEDFYSSSDSKSTTKDIACVRGATESASSFSRDGNGIVTDTKTNLMWQDDTVVTSKSMTEALAYCEGLDLGGYSDWRLPNLIELNSIYDRTLTYPSLNNTFQNVTSDVYLSSTQGWERDGYAIRFDSYNGIGGSYSVGNVRCVRTVD